MLDHGRKRDLERTSEPETDAGPRLSRSTITIRVGSESARNTRSRGTSCATAWLSICLRAYRPSRMGRSGRAATPGVRRSRRRSPTIPGRRACTPRATGGLRAARSASRSARRRAREHDRHDLVLAAAGLVGDREDEALRRVHLVVFALPVALAALLAGEHRQAPLAAGPGRPSPRSRSAPRTPPPNQSAKRLRLGPLHPHALARRVEDARDRDPSSAAGADRSAIVVSLLGRSQARLELVEAVVPEGRYLSSHSEASLNAAPCSREGRRRGAAARDQAGALEHLEWWETAWTLIGNGSASSFTDASPPRGGPGSRAASGRRAP